MAKRTTWSVAAAFLAIGNGTRRGGAGLEVLRQAWAANPLAYRGVSSQETKIALARAGFVLRAGDPGGLMMTYLHDPAGASTLGTRLVLTDGCLDET